MKEQCTKCNKRKANHSICKYWETPEYHHLCCKCYVEEGNVPADWHPLCMETYVKLKTKKSITNETIK
jgi:hypothetical protein